MIIVRVPLSVSPLSGGEGDDSSSPDKGRVGWGLAVSDNLFTPKFDKIYQCGKLLVVHLYSFVIKKRRGNWPYDSLPT